jgi:outer membrane lipoprotein SlyB
MPPHQLRYSPGPIIRMGVLRNSALIWLAVLAVAVTGCAQQADVKHAPAAPVASSAAGTILTLRTVARHDSSEAWRTALLADAAASTAPDKAPLTEFIVRANTGAILSIVQMNEPPFHQGDRVIIMQDTRTRLLPSN